MRETRTQAAVERSRRRSALMARTQAGDQEAYRALLADIGPALQSFLRRRVSDQSEVEDALHDVWMALHRARHTY